MALSGSHNVYWPGTDDHYGIKVEWSATQNVANNTSTITVKVHMIYHWSINIDSRVLTVTIDGTQYKYSTGALKYNGSSASSVKHLTTFTHTVTHDSNGEKKFSIKASFPFSMTSSTYGGIGTVTASNDSITLNKIPRASSITSASDVVLGNNCSVKWTPKASTFAYKLKFMCNDVSHTTGFVSPNTTSVYTYSSVMDVEIWSKAIPSSSYGTCTVTLYTYTSTSATSPIGTDSKTFTISLSGSLKPTISSFTTTLVNGWNDMYIQGKSSCKLSATFAASSGSTISSCSISGTGLSKTGTSTSLSGTTSVFTTSGTITYTAKVTDGRGTTSTTKSISVYPYSKPTITLSAERTSSSGSIKVAYKASCASLNAKNILKTITISHKKATESTWKVAQTIDVAGKNASSLSGTITLSGYDGDDSYNFKATVTDTYGSSSVEAIATTQSEFRLININANKDGVALGKMSEDNTFDCGLAMKISNETTVPSVASIVVTSQESKTLGVVRKKLNVNNASMDVRGDLYVGDNGGITLRRRCAADEANFDGHQGYIQVREDQVYTHDSFVAPHGRFTSTDDASAFSQNNVALRVGNASGEHIDFDGDEIQAKSNAITASALYINNEGGDVNIGNTNYKGNLNVRNAIEARYGRFTSKDDASGNAQNDVALRIGDPEGEHIDFDGNEIQAKDSATEPGTLALNFDGGNVTCNGFIIPQIQCGRVSIASAGANVTASSTITFPMAFSGTPIVMVSTNVGSPDTAYVSTTNANATGVTIRVRRTTTDNTTVSWLAVYYPGIN